MSGFPLSPACQNALPFNTVEEKGCTMQYVPLTAVEPQAEKLLGLRNQLGDWLEGQAKGPVGPLHSQARLPLKMPWLDPVELCKEALFSMLLETSVRLTRLVG